MLHVAEIVNNLMEFPHNKKKIDLANFIYHIFQFWLDELSMFRVHSYFFVHLSISLVDAVYVFFFFQTFV